MTNMKELAERAEEASSIVGNAMAEKYPLGTDFDRYDGDIKAMVQFCSDATAAIEVMEKMMKGLEDAKAFGYAHGRNIINVDEGIAAYKELLNGS